MPRVDLFRSVLKQYFRDAASRVPGLTAEDKAYMYESSATDSGFLSGGNLLISGEISEEILPEDDQQEEDKPCNSEPFDPKQQVAEEEIMRVDSGFLSESFSHLSLKNPDLNDLSSPKKILNAPLVEEKEPSSWKLYYEQDEDGDTYLHIAIIKGFPEVALALMRAAPHPRLLDTRNDNAQTPLHLAVATGQWKIARWLIAAGARPSPRDNRGDSPIHIAARNGDLYSCKAITEPVHPQERDAIGLSYSVHPYQKCELDQWNYDGQTCVHVAAISGHVEVLNHLVQKGGNINAREGTAGYTVLHIAVENRDEHMMRYLISERIFDPKILTYGQKTALEIGFPVPEAIKVAIMERGVPSPYSSEDEYDSESSEEEMPYEPPSMFIPQLVNASA